MSRIYLKSLSFFALFFMVVLVWAACKKKDTVIPDQVTLEQYLNSVGHNITITTYFGGKAIKDFTIRKDEVLNIQVPIDPGADSVQTIFYADSAKLVFDDEKKYTLIDTASGKTNFLNKANFTTAVSATGQIHYYRYVISAEHYKLAK